MHNQWTMMDNQPKNDGLTFSKSFDFMLCHYTPTTTVVFGLIWRMCSRENKCCSLSMRNMEEFLHVEERSIRRSLKTLLDDKLIIETSHQAFGKSNVYAINYEAVAILLEEVGQIVTPDKKATPPKRSDKKGSAGHPKVSDHHPPKCPTTSPQNVHEGDIKEIKEEIKKESSAEVPSAPNTPDASHGSEENRLEDLREKLSRTKGIKQQAHIALTDVAKALGRYYHQDYDKYTGKLRGNARTLLKGLEITNPSDYADIVRHINNDWPAFWLERFAWKNEDKSKPSVEINPATPTQMIEHWGEWESDHAGSEEKSVDAEIDLPIETDSGIASDEPDDGWQRYQRKPSEPKNKIRLRV